MTPNRAHRRAIERQNRALLRAAERQARQDKGMRMLIDVTQPILSYDDEPVKKPDGEDMTLDYVITQSCNSFEPGENIGEDEKLRAFRISVAVNANAKVELSAEDIAFIKGRSGKLNYPLAHGRLVDLLEAAVTPEDAAEPEGESAG